MSYTVLWRYLKIILWILGSIWGWYMVNENNKYFEREHGDRKNTTAINLFIWFVFMVCCIVKCVKMFM